MKRRCSDLVTVCHVAGKECLSRVSIYHFGTVDAVVHADIDQVDRRPGALLARADEGVNCTRSALVLYT